jgi:energy-coupling factor transporter transmembrane protein EcfT
VFLLDQLLHAEPYVLALVAVVAIAYAVAASGLLVAFVGFLAVVNGGRGHLAYAILRGARRPGRKRWIGVLLACMLAAALAEVEALVMVTWVVLAPGLELGEALAGTNETIALAIAAGVSTLYWVFAAVGLPLVLRSVRGITHDLFPRRRIDRHA